MVKHTRMDQDTINKHIVEMTQLGLTDKVILEKLELMDLQISRQTLNTYRANLGDQISKIQSERQAGLVLFYRDALETAINNKIKNAQQAIANCKKESDIDEWHDEIIDSFEKLYLLKDGLVQGIETDQPISHDSTERQSQKEVNAKDWFDTEAGYNA